MGKYTFTAFCQEKSGRGTIWISDVEVDENDVVLATEEAIEQCADDWGYDMDDIHCLGLIEGSVSPVYWDDLDDD